MWACGERVGEVGGGGRGWLVSSVAGGSSDPELGSITAV